MSLAIAANFNRSRVSVCHRYATATSLDRACAAAGKDWLTAREMAEFERWRHPGRRQAWQRSRILAKQIVAGYLERPIESIEIFSPAPKLRPECWVDGQRHGGCISISHSARGVLAAYSCEADTAVGVDLADNEPLAASLIEKWFTADEKAWLEKAGPSLGPLLWAGKEAVFKACNHGEPFAPRRVEILPDNQCRYRGRLLDTFRLRSWIVDRHVAVVVSLPNYVPSSNSFLV